MNAHLGRSVQRYVGRHLLDQLGNPEILHNKGINPQLTTGLNTVDQFLPLAVKKNRVEGNVHPDTVEATEFHCLFKLIIGKILGAAAGVQGVHSKIDAIRAVPDRRKDALRLTGWRKHFALSGGC